MQEVYLLNQLEQSIVELVAKKLSPKDPAKPRAVKAAMSRVAQAIMDVSHEFKKAAQHINIDYSGHASAHWIAGGTVEPDIHGKFGTGTFPVRYVLSEVRDILTEQKSKTTSEFATVMMNALIPPSEIILKRQKTVRTERRHGEMTEDKDRSRAQALAARAAWKERESVLAPSAQP